MQPILTACFSESLCPDSIYSIRLQKVECNVLFFSESDIFSVYDRMRSSFLAVAVCGLKNKKRRNSREIGFIHNIPHMFDDPRYIVENQLFPDCPAFFNCRL